MSDVFGEDFERELSDVARELEGLRALGDAVGNTLTRGLRGAILEGRSLRMLLADIGKAFADIALRAALKPLGDLLSGSVQTVFAGFNPALRAMQPFADGGGFSAPSYFPPAERWGQGDGGLSGVPGGSGGTRDIPVPMDSGRGGITVNFHVTTRDAPSFMAAEAEVSAMLLRAVRRGGRGS